jgi:hypothetical protein
MSGCPFYGISNTGSVDSQGDVDLEAQAVRSEFGVSGTNIRVGVISSGIAGIFSTGCTSCGPTSSVPSPITLGDIPNAVGTRQSGVLVSVASTNNVFTATPFPSGGNLEESVGSPSGAGEGTAMLEIVNDLAPNADLAFANAASTMDFENAVNSLSQVSDILVDDRLFLEPPYDGTSSVSTNTADALNNDSNQIRAYITSVGNWALDHYQGTYADSGVDGTLITEQEGDFHQFGSSITAPVTTDAMGLGSAPFDPVLVVPPNGVVTVYLGWNDPSGASSNDYDLFLVPLSCIGPINALPPTSSEPCKITGSALAQSTNPQTGTQDPSEYISWTNLFSSPIEVGIAIQNVQNKAQARTFDMFIESPDGKTSFQNHNFNTAPGSVGSQSDSGGSPVSVISVGAMNADQCDGCVGPLEPYSSQGPTQATPQGASRNKPDLVAVDHVCVTGAGGFGTPDTQHVCTLSASSPNYTPSLFGGTSAAAPHVAAIAALLLQAAPCLLSSSSAMSPSSARAALSGLLLNNANALPGYSGSSPNNQVGYGLVNAYGSMTSLLPNTIVSVTLPGSTATSSGNSAVVSAQNSNGVTLELTGSQQPNSGISNCQPKAMKWSGDCGQGSATATSASITCPIGVNEMMVALSYDGSTFLPLSQLSVYTITVTDFSLQANPITNTTLAPGASAVYTVSALSTAQGTFSNPITLSCASASLPPGAVCSFSSPTVTPGGAASILTLYTTTTANSGDQGTMPRKPNAFAFVILVPFSFGGLFCLRNRMNRLSRNLLSVLCLSLATSLCVSCSSHHTMLSPTTYSITVNGISNQLQHSATVSLTVD